MGWNKKVKQLKKENEDKMEMINFVDYIEQKVYDVSLFFPFSLSISLSLSLFCFFLEQELSERFFIFPW